MSARFAPSLALLVVLLGVHTSPASATVSGTLTPPYGSPLAVQTSQSNVGGSNTPYAVTNENDQSQLDAAYGYVSNGTLYLFFSGSLIFWVQLEGGINHWQPLDVFIDCAPGGQHQLLSNNPAPDPQSYNLNDMAGLTFDAGFAPDYWLSLGGSTTFFWPNLGAYFASLPTGGGGSGLFLGTTQPGPPGVLSGGINPYGIEVTLDDSNKLGLGNGCGAAATPAVQTGIEWAIPLAAIGNPTGCIRVAAFVSATADHSTISNQVMGPIPPGTCSLVAAGSVDFSATAGDQFFTICAPTPAHSTTWGRLKTLYR